jgi:hypothetical protein
MNESQSAGKAELVALPVNKKLVDGRNNRPVGAPAASFDVADPSTADGFVENPRFHLRLLDIAQVLR